MSGPAAACAAMMGRAARGQTVTFPHLHGAHWAYAVLAALTVGEALGIAAEEALRALRGFAPPAGPHALAGGRGRAGAAGRLAQRHAGQRCRWPRRAGRHRHGARAAAIAALGDMLRLGDGEERAHAGWAAWPPCTRDYLVTQGAARRGHRGCGRARGHAMPSASPSRIRRRMPAALCATSRATGSRTAGARLHQRLGRDAHGAGDGAAAGAAGARRALLDRQTQAWRRVVVMRPDRPTWLEIDLSAIGRNTRLIKQSGRAGCAACWSA